MGRGRRIVPFHPRTPRLTTLRDSLMTPARKPTVHRSLGSTAGEGQLPATPVIRLSDLIGRNWSLAMTRIATVDVGR
jgi:hypothetical protein